MARTRLRVVGTVQGVGFRPFVYRHAVALGLTGFVRNDSEGVLIEVEGAVDRIDELTRRLVDEPPPLAHVESVRGASLPEQGGAGFRIEDSGSGGTPTAAVAIDSATCPDCLAEVGDPADRRYRYPFTNCTNCGPRYTIVEKVPYDRATTTMAPFAMCRSCREEYDDPADRRFHAQPNACPLCGPTLTFRLPDGEEVASGEAALEAAVQALRERRILAIKGLGGYHLAVVATDEAAVAELRRRKLRDDKPFAVMVADLAAADLLCDLDEGAREALRSPRGPIVIAPRRAEPALAPSVAPALSELGLMLPYTALHHLLLSGVGQPLVMTSGNLTDEPIAHDDEDAISRLGPVVDGLLTHDRAIHIRCDDSIARAGTRRLQILRRSRGYSPEPLALPMDGGGHVLAVGAELKNTIAVARDGFVVASHHLGDLEHLAAYRSFRQALDHLMGLYQVTPDVVAHDLHPEYLSTKLAHELDLPLVGVQHHHAHIASCMVEHGRTEPVLGIAFDGLGFGLDGTLWGGEFLAASLEGFKRVGHLQPVAMPGGSAAVRQPWRMGAVWASRSIEPTAVARQLGVDDDACATVLDLAARGPSPITTSAGRLFDAVAALVTGRTDVTYEAQAAIELEALALTIPRLHAPRFDGSVEFSRPTAGVPVVLDPSALVATVMGELARQTDPALVAAGFHEALGRATADLAADLASTHALDTVALSGGVLQNIRFSDVVESRLIEHGLRVLTHQLVPPNDGGISIGQAAIASARGRFSAS